MVCGCTDFSGTELLLRTSAWSSRSGYTVWDYHGHLTSLDYDIWTWLHVSNRVASLGGFANHLTFDIIEWNHSYNSPFTCLCYLGVNPSTVLHYYNSSLLAVYRLISIGSLIGSVSSTCTIALLYRGIQLRANLNRSMCQLWHPTSGNGFVCQFCEEEILKLMAGNRMPWDELTCYCCSS